MLTQPASPRGGLASLRLLVELGQLDLIAVRILDEMDRRAARAGARLADGQPSGAELGQRRPQILDRDTEVQEPRPFRRGLWLLPFIAALEQLHKLVGPELDVDQRQRAVWLVNPKSFTEAQHVLIEMETALHVSNPQRHVIEPHAGHGALPLSGRGSRDRKSVV